MRSAKLLSGALLAVAAQAQQTAWGQCGGQGWTGPTTCVSGYYCYYSNPWYSQCLPGTGGTTSTSKAATSTTSIKTTTTTKPTTTTANPTTSTTKAAATGLRWLGVDESGAEFGQTSIPGTYGKDFIFPATSSLDVCSS
jgi:endoglucanase